MKIESTTFSKYRQEIYGISAIGIILLHINKYVSLLPMTTIQGKILSIIFENGNIGVDIFLILSAIGLSRSIKCNSISSFYIHRFQRVYLPYLIIAVLYFSWFDLFFRKDGLLQLFLNVTTINYWIIGDKYPLWFISFILLIYLLFPILYWSNIKYVVINKILILFFIIIEIVLYKINSPIYLHYEIALSRIPIFLLGLSISEKNFSINTRKILLIIWGGGISLIFAYMVSLPQMFIRYLLTWFGIAVVLIYIIVREKSYLYLLANIHKYIGKYSLELYINHVLLIQIIKAYKLWKYLPNTIWYIFIPVLSLFISIIIANISKQLIIFFSRIK